MHNREVYLALLSLYYPKLHSRALRRVAIKGIECIGVVVCISCLTLRQLIPLYDDHVDPGQLLQRLEAIGRFHHIRVASALQLTAERATHGQGIIDNEDFLLQQRRSPVPLRRPLHHSVSQRANR